MLPVMRSDETDSTLAESEKVDSTVSNCKVENNAGSDSTTEFKAKSEPANVNSNMNLSTANRICFLYWH